MKKDHPYVVLDHPLDDHNGESCSSDPLRPTSIEMQSFRSETANPILNCDTNRSPASQSAVLPHQDTSKATRRYDWEGSWTWEIGGAALSIICVALLIGFLAFVNGLPYASWQYSISPNTVISVIGTVAKTAMLVPVSACLGQLKWNQVTHQTTISLYQFHVLDQASRGPWGAVEAFWRIKSAVPLAGASLVILSIALDPFAQQVLVFPSRDVPARNETAYIQKAQEYKPAWTTDGNANMEPAMQVAVMTGLARMNYPLEPHCPTGRCEYPDIATLGVCTACEDITGVAEQECQPFTSTSTRWDEWKASLDAASVNQSSIYASVPADCSYSTPSGLQFTPDWLYSFQSDNRFTVVRSPFTSVTSKAEVNKHPGAIASVITAKYPFEDVIYTAANSSEFEHKPEITHCVVTLCERLYTRNTVTVGNRMLQPSRSQVLKVEDIHTWPHRLIPAEGTKTFSHNASYVIGPFAYASLISYLADVLNTTVYGTLSSSGEHEPYAGLGPIIYNSGSVADSFSHMATSMTNQIRSSVEATHVRGLVIRTETFIHVRWPWILVPTFLVAMSLVFFLSTAVRSRSQPVLWKSSIFPLLIGQLETRPGHEIAHLRHIGALQAMAKNINVVVEQDHDRLVFFERQS